jgi:hypothetical protein
MPFQGAQPERWFGARVEARAQQTGQNSVLPLSASRCRLTQAAQRSIRRVRPAEMVVQRREEPFGRLGNARGFQTQALFKSGQYFSPCGIRLRPGSQGLTVVGFQVEDGGRPATGFQKVEIGQQGIEGVPGAGLQVMIDQAIPQVGGLGRQPMPGQPFQRFTSGTEKAVGTGEQEATVQSGQVRARADAQVVVLQVVQAQVSVLIAAGQRAVHNGLRQVEHVIVIQPQRLPKGAQHGERDGSLFREDGQIQVAGAGVLR